MTADRRLDAVERSLTPTQRVLVWLDEAHAHGGLEAYVRWLLEQPPDVFPLDRLAREAVAGARAGVRSTNKEAIDAAVRKALRETVFRFELVMRINVVAHELIERQVLLDGVLSAQAALLLGEKRGGRRSDASDATGLAQIRRLNSICVTELRAAQEARARAEARYLDSHPALFPNTVRAWADQVTQTERLADLVARLAEIDGLAPVEPEDPGAVSIRAGALLGDLVEPAKVTALEKLGEGAQAMGMATHWLRRKLMASESAPGATG